MGDDAIDAFFQSSYAPLVASIGAAFGGAVPAEDVVQEALVRAWEHGARGGDPIASLPGWVRVVATNLGRDHLRRSGSLERAYQRLAFEPVFATAADVLGERLSAAVAKLPPRQQQVVVLHYRDDLPVAAIATTLGISPGTVKSTLARARANLAEVLRPDRSQPVKGWTMAGSRPADYEHGIADGESPDGNRVAFVRSRIESADGFGTLMQTISADEQVGHRVRFSGHVRCEAVEDWAGLWMRVDGRYPGLTLAFDNMQSRAIKGTRGWDRYEVVLDVAAEAAAVALGVLLAGTGKLWLADLAFEAVSTDVPVTKIRRHSFPENLDFSQD